MKTLTQAEILSFTIEKLEQQIQYHNHLYFEKTAPEISDYDFDQLVLRLQQLSPNSPVLTQIHSDASSLLKTLAHKTPMLSLDKCYSEEELKKWAEKIEGDFWVMPKIDGMAIELRYDSNGLLQYAVTRGDGWVGEVITENAKRISDIPLKICTDSEVHYPMGFPKGSEDGSPFGQATSLNSGRRLSIEIRGEIFMRLSVFEKYKNQFANPRNLAAGAVKQKDPQKTAEYNLSFFGYDVLGLDLKTEEEKFALLKKFQIPTVEAIKINHLDMLSLPSPPLAGSNHNLSLQQAFDYFLSKRSSEDFETDGVVFKANLISAQNKLGHTAHHPRYAIAYKFQGDSGVTTLKEVEWSVSRTQVITPVGIVEPVQLSGASVQHVSLHNIGLMQKLGLRVGAKVLMMRRGGVIPNLETVLEAGEGAEIKIPKFCPSCHAPTEVRDDFLYCTSQKACRQAKLLELEHFLKVIECDGFGEKLIAKLYDEGLVLDAADFFDLKIADLINLERMGETLAAKLITNLEAVRKLSLEKFLRALGIRELAKHSAKILVKQFGTLNKILTLQEEDLENIHTFGPVIAREVVQGLIEKKDLILKLLQKLQLDENPVQEKLGKLSGKAFLFTGKLSAMGREDAEKKVEAEGGVITSSVTKDLSYLVVGEEAFANLDKGNKWLKAEKLNAKGEGPKIISENEFLEMINL